MEALRLITIGLMSITLPILAWSVYQIQKANRLKERYLEIESDDLKSSHEDARRGHQREADTPFSV